MASVDIEVLAKQQKMVTNAAQPNLRYLLRVVVYKLLQAVNRNGAGGGRVLRVAGTFKIVRR